MDTILITGARGFIARHLARALRTEDRRVVGVSRTGGSLDEYDALYPGQLGRPLDAVFDRERVTAVIHTAYEAGSTIEAQRRINVAGTIRWAEHARSAGVTSQIFLSSLSAETAAHSPYGWGKRETERWFVEAGQVVFRLGLVIGPGGFFARIARLIRRYPVIPLLDDGRALVYPLGIAQQCAITSRALSAQLDGLRGEIWSLPQPEPFRLKEVMDAIRRRLGLVRLFVPVPSLAVLLTLQAVEALSFGTVAGWSLNVRGLRQGGLRPVATDFARFGLEIETLDALVEKAFSEGTTHERSAQR